MKMMTRNAAVALTATSLLTAPLAFAQEEGDEPQGEETEGMQGMMEGMQGGMGMMPMMAQMNEMMETCTKMMQAQMNDEGEEEKDI